MYPTVGHFLHLHLPIPTFGLFMVLAFAAAYYAFLAEFDRRLSHPNIPLLPPTPRPSGPNPVSPRRLMDKLLLWCTLTGFAGAFLFAKLEQHYTTTLPLWPQLLQYNGLNYYGSLLAGTTTYWIITIHNGFTFADAADIGSPGMMLAYGIGRLGCHLSGDGDWGIMVRHPKPSWLPGPLWSSTYPHNVLHRGITIPDCIDSAGYCTRLPIPVYPTSLYEALVCILLFFLLWTLRRKLKTPGLLFGLFALLNGIERFTIEFIRINPRYSLLGLYLSQAQFIALACILIGAYSIFRFSRK